MKKQSIIREKLHNAPHNRQHNSKKKAIHSYNDNGNALWGRRTSPKTVRNRYSAFSLVVTMVGFKLMYYVDFIAFMEEPEKTWNDILAKRDAKSAATT